MWQKNNFHQCTMKFTDKAEQNSVYGMAMSWFWHEALMFLLL